MALGDVLYLVPDHGNGPPYTFGDKINATSDGDGTSSEIDFGFDSDSMDDNDMDVAYRCA